MPFDVITWPEDSERISDTDAVLVLLDLIGHKIVAILILIDCLLSLLWLVVVLVMLLRVRTTLDTHFCSVPNLAPSIDRVQIVKRFIDGEPVKALPGDLQLSHNLVWLQILLSRAESRRWNCVLLGGFVE